YQGPARVAVPTLGAQLTASRKLSRSEFVDIAAWLDGEARRPIPGSRYVTGVPADVLRPPD
ncbi:MAG: hypothetical protein ACREUC_21665, partial [Steroidobacteraceae bacterium]